MASVIVKHWYLLRHEDNAIAKYLCYAENLQEAYGSFGILAEGLVVHLLDFGELHKITGCLIPSQHKASDWATGNLTFLRNNKLFTIWNKPLQGG